MVEQVFSAWRTAIAPAIASLLADVPLLADVSLLADVENREPLLVRLNPAERASVLLALLAIVLSGMAIVTLAWVGARFRRIARKPVPPVRPPGDDWHRKPLGAPLADADGRGGEPLSQ